MSSVVKFSKNNNEPKYYAFFDLDNTLVDMKTMFSFLRFFFAYKYGIAGIARYKLYMLLTTLYESLGVSRSWLNQRYYKTFAKNKVSCIDNIVKHWFDSKIKGKDIYINETLLMLKKHKRLGATIVLVSGSFMPCVKAIANELNVEHVLATQLESKNGKYKAKIIPPQTIGKGKAVAIHDFIKPHKNLLEKSFAYGDHESDLDMLMMVGNPWVIPGNEQLDKYAQKFGFNVVTNNIGV